MRKNDSVTFIVTESAGDDGAVVVFIDTNFEPDASDGGPGLRVMLNDGDIFVGVPMGEVDEDYPYRPGQ